MTSRAELLSNLTKDRKPKSNIPIFDFDKLHHPGLNYMLPPQLMDDICKIVADVKLDNADGKKYRRQFFKDALGQYGWVRLGGGTNREVFKHLDDQSVVLKIAIDSLARNNNVAELGKQHWLKPFCTKMFDVSQCGTLGLMERGEPIVNRMQFAAVAKEVFNIIDYSSNKGLVIGDGGYDFFMNYVIRKGFGPVMCDFTSVYKTDKSKLRCRRIDRNTGRICGGTIDYQPPSLSKLVCDKCGGVYSALDLAKEVETMEELIQLTRSDEVMKITIRDAEGNIISQTKPATDVIRKTETQRRREYRDRVTVRVREAVEQTEEPVATPVEETTVSNTVRISLNKPQRKDHIKVSEIPAEEKVEKVKIRLGGNEPVKSVSAPAEDEEPVRVKVKLQDNTAIDANRRFYEKEEPNFPEVKQDAAEAFKEYYGKDRREKDMEYPEVEEVQTPEPTSNGDRSEELHELVENVREQLKEAEEKKQDDIESMITINGKPVDFSQYEEDPVKEEPKVEEKTEHWDEETIGHRYQDRPVKRVPRMKMDLDRF